MDLENYKPGMYYKKSMSKMPFITLFVIVVIALLVLLIWWNVKSDVTNVTQERIEITEKLLGKESLDIYIVYEEDYKISSYAVGQLENKIERYAVEGKIVDIHYTKVNNTFETSWTINELEHFLYDNTEIDTNRAYLAIACVSGTLSASPGAVGLNWKDYNIALFEETMEEWVDSQAFNFDLNEYEASILIHEWGHAIGLVNKGYESSTNYEDSSHPAHSSSPRSVMHYAVEFLAVTADPPTDFGIAEEKDISGLKEAAGLEETPFIDAFTGTFENLLSQIALITIAVIGTSYIWYMWGCKARICKDIDIIVGEENGEEKE